MGDFFDKANAIWKALDEMSEKDPAGYQKFIQEQLEGGHEMFNTFGNQATADSTPNTNSSKMSKSNNAKDSRNQKLPINSMFNMFGQFSEMGLGQGTGIPNKTPSSNKDTGSGGNGSGDQLKSTKPRSSSTQKSLLDDSIGNSVIASIVSKESTAASDEQTMTWISSCNPSSMDQIEDPNPLNLNNKKLIEEL